MTLPLLCYDCAERHCLLYIYLFIHTGIIKHNIVFHPPAGWIQCQSYQFLLCFSWDEFLCMKVTLSPYMFINSKTIHTWYKHFHISYLLPSLFNNLQCILRCTCIYTHMDRCICIYQGTLLGTMMGCEGSVAILFIYYSPSFLPSPRSHPPALPHPPPPILPSPFLNLLCTIIAS